MTKHTETYKKIFPSSSLTQTQASTLLKLENLASRYPKKK